MKFGDFVGSLLFLWPRTRDRSLSNLRLAFPEKDSAELESIGRQSRQEMAKVVIEFLRIPVVTKDPDRYIEMRGEEHVWSVLERKKGMIFVISHFGNWELSAISAAFKHFPIHAIGKKIKNPFINSAINRLRGATGLKTIEQDGAIKKTIALLKQNQVICMLVDEHVKNGEVWIDFFGRPAATSSLPAMLAVKYDVPVVPAFYHRNGSGRAMLVIDKPFETIRTGDAQKDLESNTQLYVWRLEREIRKSPGSWTQWMRRRWREQPAAA